MKPIVGQPPFLEWIPVQNLNIDPEYQRSISGKSSQKLIRDIAEEWDWKLCPPLQVARRKDATLWVVDGQHRLTAARLRPDLPKLPCVINVNVDHHQEAKTFVDLNRKRRALNSVDVFRASLVAGSERSVEVMELIKSAGFVIAPHSNYNAWTPGMLYCVSGIASSYIKYGETITMQGLTALRTAFRNEIMQYAGQLLRGLVFFYATEGTKPGFDSSLFVERLGRSTQQLWMRKMSQHVATTGDNIPKSLSAVFTEAYRQIGI